MSSFNDKKEKKKERKTHLMKATLERVAIFSSCSGVLCSSHTFASKKLDFSLDLERKSLNSSKSLSIEMTIVVVFVFVVFALSLPSSLHLSCFLTLFLFYLFFIFLHVNAILFMVQKLRNAYYGCTV